MSDNAIVMSFHSGAVSDGTLRIAGATGSEALAQPFRFDLDLVSDKPGLDLVALLGADASVTLNRVMVFGDGRTGTLSYDYHGMLAEIRQVGRAGFSQFRYRAVLRPKLWKLSYTKRSRIFIDKNVPDLLKEVLGHAGIPFKLKLSKDNIYPIYRYAVQYEETDLDFITRWMEQVGISYYYDIDGDQGSLVLIDNPRGYAPISPYGEKVVFDDRTLGRQTSIDGQPRIRKLEVEEIQIPRTVQLKDHNGEAPDEALFFEAEVDPKGIGTWYEYNSNYLTESEGRFLLRIRREYWLGRRRRLAGTSDHRSLQPGRTFTPVDHYNPSVSDRSFVLIEVQHRIVQENAGEATGTGEYSCDFTAMPAELAYRPERITTWPSIHGVVQAKVVGGALAYAELDDMGRYRIAADYDAGKQTIGKIRMAQPSAGEDAGFHFPLRKDTEVLLGHIDGDPDRPIIIGAVHDGKKINLLDNIRDPLGTINSIRSQGGNLLQMGDDSTNKFITLMNGSCNAIQQFGRPEHSDPGSNGSSSTNSGGATRPVPLGSRKPSPDPSALATGPARAGKTGTPQAPAGTPQATAPKPGAQRAAGSSAKTPSPGAGPGAAQPGRFDGSSSAFASGASGEVGSNDGDVRDRPIARFWAAVKNAYNDAGDNTVTQNEAAGTSGLTFDNDWKSLAYQEFAAIWTIPAPQQGKDFDAVTPNFPPNSMGAALMTTTSLGNNPPATPDPLTPWIVPLQDASNPNDLGIRYPGQSPSFYTQDSDWGDNFANFTATAGGTMKFSLGDDLEVAHGNQYRYRRGTICNWQIGDLHNVGTNGNTYNYNWGSSEVSFNMGPSTVCTYNDDTSSEWTYSVGTGNYEQVNGNVEAISLVTGNVTETSTIQGTHTEISTTATSVAIETVGVAQAVSNVGAKSEFEAVGASLSLHVGGPQLEMSLNIAKLAIEGEVSATFTLAAKVDVSLAPTAKLELVEETSFSLDKTGIHLSEDKIELLKEEIGAMKVDTKLLVSSSVGAVNKKLMCGMREVGVALNQGGAEMQTIAAAIQTGFKIHL
jgi:type VI secretion system secreted protein VgrG